MITGRENVKILPSKKPKKAVTEAEWDKMINDQKKDKAQREAFTALANAIGMDLNEVCVVRFSRP